MAQADSDVTDSDVNVFFSLIQHRLILMKDVAAFKHQHHVPTFFPGIEQKLLADMRETCERVHLDLFSVQQFIEVQLRAAVEIQNGWRSSWNRNGFDYHSSRDLEKDLRPELKETTKQIVNYLAKVQPVFQDADQLDSLKTKFNESIQVEFLRDEHKVALFESLTRVKKS